MKAYTTNYVWDGAGNRVKVWAAGTSIPKVREWTETGETLNWRLDRDPPPAVATAVQAATTVEGMVFTETGELRVDLDCTPEEATAVARLVEAGAVELGFAARGYRPAQGRMFRLDNYRVHLLLSPRYNTTLRGYMSKPGFGSSVGLKAFDRKELDRGIEFLQHRHRAPREDQ